MYYSQTGSAKWMTLAVIIAVCGILAAAVMLMPKGFKDDLSLIGQGSVSVVLVHDKNLVAGTTTMELLNKVRSDYEGTVNFLAVDVVTPIGRTFMREQGVNVIDLVVFDQDGAMKRVMSGGGLSEQQLRSVIDDLLTLSKS
ncbi:MAG: hypothetical protein ACI8VC_002971 [Candidatus Endobugula sp.]|jgi:hypothetical protein